MDQKKQSGFSLFPQPPTPPARRRRKGSLSLSSNKLIKSQGSDRDHCRKLSLCGTDSIPASPALIPAPLRIRRSDEDIPPLPLTIPALPVSTPVKKKKKGYSLTPATPEKTLLQVDTDLPRTPSRRYDANTQAKLKPRAVSDFMELEASNRRRASTRLSQWLDIEDGEIDRRRLSMYLGSVLDNTFEIPTFESMPLPPITPIHGMFRDPSRPTTSASKRPASSLRPPTGRCDCPVGVVICHCSSSPDFERFKNWSQHKPNSSISSTACILGVPRARFQSTFYDVPEPPMAELLSPPGLCYDSEEEFSEMSDWHSPKTPSKDDVFTSPRAQSYSSKCVASTSTSMSAGQSRLQSFSRPFRPESTTLCLSVENSPPSTPSRKQGKPKSLKLLKSISTLSSFEFDFDFESIGKSSTLESNLRACHELPAFVTNDATASANHARNESGESFTSQLSQAEYELSTATATVARTSENMKPVLVNNSGKKKKSSTSKSSTSSSTSRSSHSHSHSRSKSRSISTSLSDLSHGLSLASSSFQSWRTANEYFSRSRSCTTTTNASNMTTDSNGLTALLHMPLLAPHLKHVAKGSKAHDDKLNDQLKKEICTSTDSTVSGNAFTRSKSSPMPKMPTTASKEVVSTQNPHQNQSHGQQVMAARSNTYAGYVSNRVVSSPCTISTADRNITTENPSSSPASAVVPKTTPRHRRGQPSRSGQRHGSNSGSISISKSHRNSNYLYVDDRATSHRDDSGVFGVMNPPLPSVPSSHTADPTHSAPQTNTQLPIHRHPSSTTTCSTGPLPVELPTHSPLVFELENEHGYEYECEPRFYRCLSNAARAK